MTIRRSIIALLCALCSIAYSQEQKLEYAPAPVANPLKGLVPYPGETRSEKFPHSMEFAYLKLSDFVTGEREYRWDRLEKTLNEISGRRHQTVMRVYVEYPGQSLAQPAYLGEAEFPDYESPALRACLRDFIAAFGKKYDGDPRIGYICVGLLGKWGEWHTWPEHERWASKEVQVEVMNAYQKAFKKTPAVLRYPRGASDDDNAENTSRPFGYHDDSFAWSTLEDGGEWDSSFVALLKRAGAQEKWKRYPIGGEIRPEVWGIVFDEKPEDPKVQNFAECVRQTHVSWLMDSGMFSEKTWTAERRRRGEEQVRKMGYEFYVASVEVGEAQLTLKIENRGVAPFYADWPIELGVLETATGKVIHAQKSSGTLLGIMPGDKAERSVLLKASGLAAGQCLAIRVPNGMTNGLPVRFANKTQDQHASGWLTLVEL